MRSSPSIIPDDADRDIYLVLDDFVRLGRPWRETDERAADRDALIRDLLDGQYRNLVRIVAFNTAEGWSRDLTEEIACRSSGSRYPGRAGAATSPSRGRR
jgi:hypothetical protein